MTEPEPLPDGHPLFNLENVVLTPHAGGVSPELMETMTVTAATLALSVLRDRRPRHMVNPQAWAVRQGRSP